ncbi:hypothetical protein BGZ90_003677 [Linnemannia elongata]|nr:hypothetical protein BGZ90_003677 [Linnemannia elongata]
MLAVHPTRDKSVHWAACHHPVLLREDQGPNIFGDRECWKPGGAGPLETHRSTGSELESLLRSKQEMVKDSALPEICSKSISTPATSAANLVWMDWVNEIKVPVRTDDNKASQAIEELCLQRTTVSHEE